MEPEEVNLVSSGACGAFVHSLEDEFMGVCVCVWCGYVWYVCSVCVGVWMMKSCVGVKVCVRV